MHNNSRETRIQKNVGNQVNDKAEIDITYNIGKFIEEYSRRISDIKERL